jgi:hypothetical protein
VYFLFLRVSATISTPSSEKSQDTLAQARPDRTPRRPPSSVFCSICGPQFHFNPIPSQPLARADTTKVFSALCLCLERTHWTLDRSEFAPQRPFPNDHGTRPVRILSSTTAALRPKTCAVECVSAHVRELKRP